MLSIFYIDMSIIFNNMSCRDLWQLSFEIYFYLSKLIMSLYMLVD